MQTKAYSETKRFSFTLKYFESYNGIYTIVGIQETNIFNEKTPIEKKDIEFSSNHNYFMLWKARRLEKVIPRRFFQIKFEAWPKETRLNHI